MPRSQSVFWGVYLHRVIAFYRRCSTTFDIGISSFTETITKSFVLGFALYVVLFTLNYYSLGLRVGEARQNVLAAFATGELSTSNFAYGDTTIGAHQFNDCLILGMAIDQRGPSSWHNAISPLIARFGKTSFIDDPCPSLYLLALGVQPEPTLLRYHRYIHAQTTLVRYILPYVSVKTVRLFYSTTITILIFFALSYSLIQLCRGSNIFKHAFFAILFLTFSRWFGLESFSQSLSHGPSDVIPMIFALFVCCASMRDHKPEAVYMAAAIFGATTIMFEFLTGGLPLGVAMVVGVVPWLLSPKSSCRRFYFDLFLSVSAFCAAAASCVIAKLLLSLVLFGPDVLHDFVGQLESRMGLRQAQDAFPSGGALVLAQKIVGGFNSLAVRNRTMSASMLLVAMAFGTWGAVKLRAPNTDVALGRKAEALVLSNVPILIWFPLFWQHTIQHAWFMDRILVWVIVSGSALFIFALLSRSGSSLGVQD